MLNLLNIINTG